MCNKAHRNSIAHKLMAKLTESVGVAGFQINGYVKGFAYCVVGKRNPFFFNFKNKVMGGRRLFIMQYNLNLFCNINSQAFRIIPKEYIPAQKHSTSVQSRLGP